MAHEYEGGARSVRSVDGAQLLIAVAVIGALGVWRLNGKLR